MLPTRILATASALPARVVTTAELAERIGIDPERAVRATGVRERRWVEPGEDPLRYGARALTDALTAAGLRIDQLDLLIHASGGTPQPIPDGSAHLAELTGFRGGQAFSVHSTCVSALVGMHQAALQIATGQVRSAAVVSCEASSRGLDLTDPESSLLFGDGAAAVILGPAEREGQGIVRYLAQMWPEGAAATEIRSIAPSGPPRETTCATMPSAWMESTPSNSPTPGSRPSSSSSARGSPPLWRGSTG